MNCPLFLLRADGSGGLFQTLGNRPSLVIVVGKQARPMEHGQISIGIAMHAHTRLDVMATMLIHRNLQAQSLKTHAVVGSDRALKLLAQDVIQTATNPRHES